MERNGNTITEEWNGEKVSYEISDIFKHLHDNEIATEFGERFKNGDKLKRALCDMFGIGYHSHQTGEILSLLRSKII